MMLYIAFVVKFIVLSTSLCLVRTVYILCGGRRQHYIPPILTKNS